MNSIEHSESESGHKAPDELIDEHGFRIRALAKIKSLRETIERRAADIGIDVELTSGTESLRLSVNGKTVYLKPLAKEGYDEVLYDISSDCFLDSLPAESPLSEAALLEWIETLLNTA